MANLIPSVFTASAKLMLILILVLNLTISPSWEATTCKMKADVLLSFDTSGSFGNAFTPALNFAANLVNSLDESRFRIGALLWRVGYNNDTIVFDFSSKLTKAQKIEKIRNAGTLTSLAGGDFEHSFPGVIQMFKNAKPRHGDVRILVTFTDGDFTNMLTEAQKLTIQSNNIISLGVAGGRYYRYSGVLDMVLGVPTHIWSLGDWNQANLTMIPEINKLPCHMLPETNGTLNPDEQDFHCFQNIEKGVTINFQTGSCYVTAYFSYRYPISQMTKKLNEGVVDYGSSFYPNVLTNPVSTQICVLVLFEGNPPSGLKKVPYSLTFTAGGEENY